MNATGYIKTLLGISDVVLKRGVTNGEEMTMYACAKL